MSEQQQNAANVIVENLCKRVARKVNEVVDYEVEILTEETADDEIKMEKRRQIDKFCTEAAIQTLTERLNRS